jgi:RNA polymerase sigma factor (sigma-70 family)
MVPGMTAALPRSMPSGFANLAELSDEQLLGRFVQLRDEAAFAVLLERHGPLVYRVCRRTLGDASDAEDAFQATFLVLVKKGGTLRNPAHLASWLYGVAYRTSLKAKARAAQRSESERRACNMPTDSQLSDMTYRDMCSVLDEEISKLPEKYAAPLVLCYLEGKTNAEAAQQLGWPEGSMSRRLARARELLRSRLTQRGLTLSALLTAALVSRSAVASVPLLLAQSTAQAAKLVAEGVEVADVVSPATATLVEDLVQPAISLVSKVSAAVALAAVIAVTSGVVWYFGAPAYGANGFEAPWRSAAQYFGTPAAGGSLPAATQLAPGGSACGCASAATTAVAPAQPASGGNP